ncbi:hypothetical protein M0805_006181 [Coniferiporia weirii]|nr:hypothetical protein M0805_006181 [Coniferiporia weirii]
MKALSNSTNESTRTVVPIAALYSPKQHEDPPPVLYGPVACDPFFRAVLNPYCQIDIRGKLWICAPRHACCGCWDVAPNTLVGLITFGTMTHDTSSVGYAACTKAYVSRGLKDYSPKQIQDKLGLSSQNRAAPCPGPAVPQNFSAAHFLEYIHEGGGSLAQGPRKNLACRRASSKILMTTYAAQLMTRLPAALWAMKVIVVDGSAHNRQSQGREVTPLEGGMVVEHVDVRKDEKEM